MKLFRTIAGLVGGATVGLLFAQKKGKDLRKDLLKDKDKMLEVLGKEFVSVGKEISEEVKKIAETEDAQEMIKAAKTKFKGITELAKKEGGEFAKEVEKYLAEISKYTKEKADEIDKTIKPKVTKTAKNVKKKKKKKTTAAKKTVAKTKKTIEKKATAVKKTAVKKATTAKKAATKTVKKAGKAVKGIVM